MTNPNPLCVEKVKKALSEYTADDDVFTAIVDVITDAGHLCAESGIDFRQALDIALAHLDAEL